MPQFFRCTPVSNLFNYAIFTFTFGISLFPSPPLPLLQNDCSSFAGAQQCRFPPCPFQVMLAPGAASDHPQ